MKSIKEKAEEYGYTNWQSDEYHDGASEGLEFDAIGHTQKTFEAGANYVLDILEKELDRIWFDNKFGDLFDNSAVDYTNVREICKHFFEFGMAVGNKAQKGEKV